MEATERLSVPIVHGLLERLGIDFDARSLEIELNEQHSNSLAVARLGPDRRLIVKRARYDWMAERLHTSYEASRLLHERTELFVPRYLEMPVGDGGEPVLAYWWIPNPTLDDIWGELDPDQRMRALTECGRLLRRIHTVELVGHGSLREGVRTDRPLARFLDEDLRGRLRPAMEVALAHEVPALDRLHEAFAALLGRRADPPAVLVHNDLFTANVLCARDETGIHSVGVLDFEDAFAGPREADLAKTEVLHGPLFGRGLADGWLDRILEGYGGDPDVALLALFRVYHLMNMGYHAAATGLEAHAGEVAAAIERELEAWEKGLRHQEVLA
jgi:aminoglycoside phosphotransferase (APT) family kinase protein